VDRLNLKNYFDLLRGEYEPDAQNQSVPDYAFNPLNRAGELYTPVIDLEWVNQNEPPQWPGKKKFAVCLTHDVDAVSETDPAQNMRSIVKLLKTHSDRSITESLRWLLIHKMLALKGMLRGNEAHCQFEKWMEAENNVGARSTFFFAPEHVSSPHVTDIMYKYDQSLDFRGNRVSVQELMKTMHTEGWEIGLHPSWNAHASFDEMAYQKKQVEQAIGHSICSVRQHFLKYDRKVTHAIQAKAGFKYDSTLGYNDNVGFRRGTSYPFNCLQVSEGEEKTLLQIPLIAQDGALLLADKGMRLNPDEAFKYVSQLLQSVKRVGGVLTLSWHPHTMTSPTT